MARKQKVIIDFSGMTEEDFPTAVDLTVTSILANSGTFTGITVAVSLVKDEIDKYELIRKALYYAAQAADLSAQRKIVQGMITKNGNFINTLANGDLSILEQSGYPISKAPSKQGVLPKTTLSLKVSDIPAQLEFNITGAIVNGIKFALFYTLASNTETNPFKWTFLYCPVRKGTITGLTSKVDYKFVSAALGTDPTIVVSDVIIKAAS